MRFQKIEFSRGVEREICRDNDALWYLYLSSEWMCRLMHCVPCLFGEARRYLSFEDGHFGIGRETFLKYRTAPPRYRYRCSIIARLKFLAVCLRRDCSASREFIEGQSSRTAVYNYICPESGAGASLSPRGLLLPGGGTGRGEAERTNVAARHAFPVFHSRGWRKTIMFRDVVPGRWVRRSDSMILRGEGDRNDVREISYFSGIFWQIDYIFFNRFKRDNSCSESILCN